MLFLKDLRGYVSWRPAPFKEVVPLSLVKVGQPKIRDANVSRTQWVTNDKVFWLNNRKACYLDVPMDDAERMQVFQCLEEVTHKQSNLRLAEAAWLPPQMLEEFTPLQVVCDEPNVLLGLVYFI